MRVHACQPDIVWERKAANHAKVRALLDAAAPAPGDLVLLPEMFATGFSMNVAGIADDVTRETQEFLATTAAELGIYLLGGVVTRATDGKGSNEAVAYGPDRSELVRYRKIHPFTYGGEADHYVGGCEPRLFSWQEIAVAPFVCYDLRFPEVFRAAVTRGAALFAVIANWPAAREEHWVTLLRARAIENQAYVVGVNRCGSDPKLAYSGRSMIVDPRGRVLAEATAAEQTIAADVDLEALWAYRREFPVLDDMQGSGVGGQGPG